jgi:hypothetical protein
MDTDFILLGVMKIFQGFVGSSFFLALKLMLAVYVSVLFADIVMLLILRGFGDVRVSLRGANVPLISPKRMRKNWIKIEARLESGDPSQYKLAVLEADGIIDKIFQSMELKGSNMTEKLEKLSPGQMEEAEEIKNAHKIRNQIVNDPSYQIDKEKAKEALDIYAKFLTENEFMG